MEALVSGCVGVLSAASAGLLLDVGGNGAFEAWRDVAVAHVDRARELVRYVLVRIEEALASSGLLSPRLRARRAHVEEQMPEAFGALAISLGSGLSLMQAIRYVGTRADEPIRTEFLRAASEMGCGVPASEALDGLLDRLKAPGLELVTLALKVSRRTGAPLAGLLSEAAQIAGERVELARRLDVKTSQARMSARLVACMPVGMMAFLSLVSGDFRAGVATVGGMCSVVGALVLNFVAWVIIHRIMQVRL